MDVAELAAYLGIPISTCTAKAPPPTDSANTSSLRAPTCGRGSPSSENPPPARRGIPIGGELRCPGNC